MSSMLQDISEIGTSLNALSTMINEIEELGSRYRNVSRVFLVGAGSSYYASMYAASHALHAKLSKCTYALPSSEFLFNYSRIINSSDLVIAVSRSGETAETLEALSRAKANGAATVMLSISRGGGLGFIDNYLTLNIGPERSLVMTKSFVALSAAALVLMGSILNININYGESMKALVDCINRLLNNSELVGRLSETVGEWVNASISRFVFLGHGSSYPLALESALKFQETSYAATQALNTLEFRHGPVATIGERQVVVIINQVNSMSDAANRLFHELSDRSKGTDTRILMVTNSNAKGNGIINVECETGLEEFDALALITPIYLLAYYNAVKRGIDTEKPRGLVRVVKNF